jgi:hypothetical protein
MEKNKMYSCHYPGCPESFGHREQRRRHFKKVHLKIMKVKKTYPCECCDPPMVFTEAAERRLHKKKNQRFPCRWCHQVFS